VPLEQLEKHEDTYRGIRYTIRVYFSSERAYQSDGHRYIVVDTKHYHSTIEDVRSHEPLNPTSILPWRDPQPVSKETQIEQAESQFKANVDRQKKMMEKAAGGDE